MCGAIVSVVHNTPTVRCDCLSFAQHTNCTVRLFQSCTAHQLYGAIVHGLHNAKAIATSCADPSYKCTTLWEARGQGQLLDRSPISPSPEHITHPTTNKDNHNEPAVFVPAARLTS